MIQIYLFLLIDILLNALFILIVIKVPGDVKVGAFFIALLFFMGLECIMVVFFIILAKKMCFIYKFKKLNRKNVKYLIRRLIFVNAVEKEPGAIPLGKCIIISKERKIRRKFAAVNLIKRKTTLRNVLLIGDREYKDGEVYKLYEICGVKYID